MGIWAGRTIGRATYEGWMSSQEGWDYFVNTVLPDVISGGAKVEGVQAPDQPHFAPLPNLIMDVQAVGSQLGRTVPQNILDLQNNPPPPPAPTVDIPSTAAGDPNKSAKDIIKAQLDAWGLSSLTDFAWNLITQGASSDQAILEIRNRDEYKRRFGGIIALQQKGISISEQQALDYENTVNQLFHQYGITPGTYITEDVQRWLGQGTSAAELSQRMAVAADVAYSEPPEVRAALGRLYNIHTGDLTTWALNDPGALSAIQQKVNAAKIAAEASTTQFGTLNAAQAERIASFVSPDQARDPLSKLAQQSALYVPIGGENGNFTLDDVIAAYFGGDAQKLNAIRQRAEQRASEFKGGGQVAQTRQGAQGAGTARPY